MENEITLEEALKMLAAAKLQIEEQQQSLQKKDDEIAERDLKINAQIAVINQKDKQLEAEKSEKEQIKLELIKVQEELSSQLAHRFCAHSEKSDNQPSLFDFEDEEFTPSVEEIAETVAGEGPYKEVKVREYIRRKCGRKPIDDSTPTKQIYHDIPEEEKTFCRKEIFEITSKLKELRKELSLVNDIEERSHAMEKQLEQIDKEKQREVQR